MAGDEQSNLQRQFNARFGLSPAQLLNPIMLGGAYVAWPLCRWVFAHRRSLAADVIALTRRLTLSRRGLVRRRGSLRDDVPARLQRASQREYDR